MTGEGVSVTVKYCEVPQGLMLSEVLCMAREEVAARKREMVANLIGEEVPEGTSPLDAWLSHLCKLNGLEDTRPVPAALSEAIQYSEGARRFLWLLAG